MTGSLSTKGRRDGASSPCLGDFPRRLTIIGGFVLFGWFALAIAGATHAAASPGSSGHHQPPTISTMLHGSSIASSHTGSPTDAVDRVIGAVRHTARPTTSAPTGRTDAYGAAPVPLPADDPATSRPRSDARPTRARPAAAPADEDAVLNDLPVVDGLAPAIERAVDPVLKPVESAVAPVLAPVDQVVTRLGTVVRPASSTVDGLLAPVTTPVDGAVAQVAEPVSILTAGLAPAMTPLAGVLREVTSSALALPVAPPGPPAPVGGSPVVPVGSGALPAPPEGADSVSLRSAADPVAEHPESMARSVHPASWAVPVSAASRGLDRARVPAPLPTVPPSAPGLLAIASAPGAAATSNSGSGATTLPGFNADESWAAQQLQRVGVVDSGRSRAVRNSATKPPVSPD